MASPRRAPAGVEEEGPPAPVVRDWQIILPAAASPGAAQPAAAGARGRRREERRVLAVTVWAEELVHAIKFDFSDGTSRTFGRRGGQERPKWSVPPGEFIVEVRTRAGDSHDGCSFVTSAGTESPWFGGWSGRPRTFVAARGQHIVGLRMGDGALTGIPVGIEERPLRQRRSRDEAMVRALALEEEGLEGQQGPSASGASPGDASGSATAALPVVAAPEGAAPAGSREECLACMDLEADACLIPCGHVVVCRQCAPRLRPRRCPICRSDFAGIALCAPSSPAA